MIKYGKSINVKLAKDALANGLFVKGWTLQSKLSSIVNGYEEYPVALYYQMNVPVAVAIVNTEHSIFEIFVLPQYRRTGIGTKLITYLKLKYPQVKGNSNGTYASSEFFLKNGLELVNCYR